MQSMTTLIFDLDGTLIDTTGAVFPAFRETLRSFGAPVPQSEVMAKTFGLPDVEIWKMLMPNHSTDERTAAFQMSERLVLENLRSQDVLLPGAMETLSQLKGFGHLLTVASNCGDGYLNTVLDSQGLREFFTHPLCLGTVKGDAKSDILTEHFLRLDKRHAVMIGDRSSDGVAAKAHNIPFVGCAFGFGNAAELDLADVVISQLTDLVTLFPAGEPRI
ncbi:HAD family hydrolase [Alicyclobacillus tolerans]|uniref:HAD family hydrolase n=1 Tax=Alicyclobacillus tolerans TaxID=90970 RepID=UPI001F204DD4|nr:HAD family hydrolase [Alicyclobacillus tolerans]MCF8564020.1 HAD family hydrolase [Alicyclobacillus tolerans]